MRENCLEGSGASEWDINAAGSSLIQGFATKGSYAVGEEVVFKVKTASSALAQGCGAMAMAVARQVSLRRLPPRLVRRPGGTTPRQLPAHGGAAAGAARVLQGPREPPGGLRHLGAQRRRLPPAFNRDSF